MKLVRAALALVVATVLLALPTLASAQAAAVSGTLTYRDRVALPANAVVTVQIAQIQSGGPNLVVAEQRFTTNGAQPPFRYSLAYDPARIDPNRQYTVQSNISVGGQVRFTTNSIYRVITGGAPVQNVNLVLVAVGRLPNTSGGALPLVVAGTALVAAFGVFAVRRLGLARS